MHARFVSGALAFLTLFALLQACGSSSVAQPTPSSRPSPSASSPSDGSSVDWLAFQVDMKREPVGGPTAVPAPSIQDMERMGGFSFEFPSYLPAGVPGDIRLDALAQSSTGGPEESIQLRSNRKETPSIYISESICSTSCILVALPTQQIGNTDVSCELEPAGGAELFCQWTANDRLFTASFDWQTDATPTPDVRSEVMKVVESMILSPTHP
jgi:hypothetical protein